MKARVLDRERRLGDVQRTERIHHHRQLVGVLGADARLGASRVGTVRQPVGVVRDGAVLDALAAHELARRVEEHLVGVHVAVVVRCG